MDSATQIQSGKESVFRLFFRMPSGEWRQFRQDYKYLREFILEANSVNGIVPIKMEFDVEAGHWEEIYEIGTFASNM